MYSNSGGTVVQHPLAVDSEEILLEVDVYCSVGLLSNTYSLAIGVSGSSLWYAVEDTTPAQHQSTNGDTIFVTRNNQNLTINIPTTGASAVDTIFTIKRNR